MGTHGSWYALADAFDHTRCIFVGNPGGTTLLECSREHMSPISAPVFASDQPRSAVGTVRKPEPVGSVALSVISCQLTRDTRSICASPGVMGVHRGSTA